MKFKFLETGRFEGRESLQDVFQSSSFSFLALIDPIIFQWFSPLEETEHDTNLRRISIKDFYAQV